MTRCLGSLAGKQPAGRPCPLVATFRVGGVPACEIHLTQITRIVFEHVNRRAA